MDEEANAKALTIKIANAGGKKPASNSVSSSPYNSPLVSPPSSAFVSALQSPYISPRAVSSSTAAAADTGDTPVPGEGSCPTPATSLTHPSPPVSCSGSQSDDIPSTSHTPPPEKPAAAEPAPRISFSFQIPRISFAKGSVSPASNAKLRSCDVYIGYHGQNPNLVRLCKWLKSELEIQGIACFVADRARYSDNQSHEIADRVISSVAHGVAIITAASLCNHLTLEEIRFFAQKKNLIPLFFDTDAGEIAGIFNPHAGNKEFKEALDGLMRFHEHKLEANDGNWRNCVHRAAGILRSKLGRKSLAGKEPDTHDELPFPRNKHFLGRQKELMDIETAFFGCGDYWDQECNGNSHSGKTEPGPGPGQSDGLADGESEADGAKGKYISLEVGRCREPNLEAWVEPVISRSSLKRPKYKKTKSGKYSSIVCIKGSPGIGKTELALEFAYRYSQRYKMVLWVGGESKYFRQNILNLSVSMGLDVSADEERERGRIRSFDEQESEAFKRVKRELFRDTPYLLVIDDLENEREWWEGKDLHDLIPRNTGGTHVIITTRLPRVMSLDPMHLHPLPYLEATTLIRGRRRREYSADELDFLTKFDEKLGRSGFGLSVVGSLLSELSIGPSELFEAVSRQAQFDETMFGPPPTSPFLTKVLSFCTDVLERKGGARNALSSRMLRVGPWLAPGPVPADLLAAAASHVPPSGGRRKKWAKCVGPALSCFFAGRTWKCGDNDSAQLLIRLGLARRAIRQPGQLWIQFHPTAREFAEWRYGGGPLAAKATVQGMRKIGSPIATPDHLWATAFLVFGFKNEPPLVELKPAEMVLYIKRAAIPLAIRAFTAFSRCNSALELLKVCTNVLEEIEKSFVCQMQDWCHGSLCWKKKKMKSGGESSGVDEHVWQEVTLLKAALLETRAKLLIRGGNFDSGEELCRTCISIRTVMLGHNHGQTLAAQETLAKLFSEVMDMVLGIACARRGGRGVGDWEAEGTLGINGVNFRFLMSE
ncbi:P-loop containing nucleoside triphosphatehydrolases superfamily protein [Striga asiatica]|uniref:P-loop containing nucleoside triphosphatehydrolases superfamily protein n=1 Tax=Striga asiatica TaxID=4170 RepID=A0A5A7RIE7_STRAF|nr:P-loop containing nucleoside triphosphatehydrolases superfamily protein [Striga asiatica]